MRRLVNWFGRSLALALVAMAAPAQAWGDEGHKVVALIADHYLTAAVRAKVALLLAGPALPGAPDDPAEVPDTIADRATWADKYRDSDRRHVPDSRYTLTRAWHFVDVELDDPDLDAACSHEPAPDSPFPGRPDDCVVDKIVQFRDLLADPNAPPDQKVIAFNFLLHFVGDIHQPLHAADDHDQGGNSVTVRYAPAGAAAGSMLKTNLHSYWDTVTVSRLGSTPEQIAQSLIAGIPKRPTGKWTESDPSAWAEASFAVAKAKAYKLPQAKTAGAPIILTAAYATAATGAVRKQLQLAGYRLAMLLNQALK